jgi:hypothetical protein
LIEFDYGALNEVMKIIKDEKLPQMDPRFDLKCSLKTSIRESEASRIENMLLKIETLTITEV